MAGLDFCSSGGTAGSPQGGRFCLVAFAWRALDGIPLPAATTRSPDGIPCEAPLYVVLNQPSRRRSDPWRFVLGRWVLDGCWVLGGRPLGVGWPLGVGCAAGSPPGGQVDDEVTSPGSRRLA